MSMFSIDRVLKEYDMNDRWRSRKRSQNVPSKIALAAGTPVEGVGATAQALEGTEGTTEAMAGRGVGTVGHTDPGAMEGEELMEAGVMVEVTEGAMEQGAVTAVGMEEVWA
jgi:hypothetical protein